MKLEELFEKDLLLEVPLPPDWDKETFKPDVSFRKRIKYAVQKAAKIGAGSSRVAFVIPYEGRDTVLKVAKNAKGMAQNEYESQMLNDYYLKSLNLTIPMIDYDEEHDQPVWVHTEKATKVTPTIFKKYFGIDPNGLVRLAYHMTSKRRISGDDSEFQTLYENNAHVSNFVDLIGNYDMPPNDFGTLANWGVFEGNVIIIDIGLSNEVFKQHYMLDVKGHK